jgi:HlyD family secretion protein
MINNWGWALMACAVVQVGCQESSHFPSGFQGVIEFEERQLAFEFAGRLTHLNVDVGSRLQVGELIASLDDSLERAQKPIRDNEATAAEERVQLVKAGARPEEVRVAEARVRAAAALEQQLRNSLDRERQLLATGATPRVISEDLQSQLERAVAQRQELEQALKLTVRGARKEEVAHASAQAKASMASVDALEQRLKHYVPETPLAGDVVQVYIRPGEVVGVGTPIVALADTSHPYADVFVPQGNVGEFAVGREVYVKVDSLDASVRGEVEWLGRQVEFTPRFLFSEQERPNLVIRVRIRIDDEDRRLRAGVPAFVTLVESDVHPVTD